jgi:hypothetical protein
MKEVMVYYYLISFVDGSTRRLTSVSSTEVVNENDPLYTKTR